MARLALAVGEGTPRGTRRFSFRVTTRAAQLAHRAFLDSILLYRRVPEAVLFVGRGQVTGLTAWSPGFDEVHLEEYLDFVAPFPSRLDSEVRDPGVRRSLSLDEQRYDHIVQRATAGVVDDAQVLAETQAAFAHHRQVGLDAYLKIHDRVLQRWQYRCAFTGQQFKPSEARPHPELAVVAIRAREFGGPLHVRNYLPMTAAAELAWTHGHLTLGSEFGFIVAERRIDPELRERLLPLGRLAPSSDPSLWPDSDAVAYHRAHVFDKDEPG